MAPSKAHMAKKTCLPYHNIAFVLHNVSGSLTAHCQVSDKPHRYEGRGTVF